MNNKLRSFRTVVCAAVLSIGICLSARAQEWRKYNLLGGFSTVMYAGRTNQFVISGTTNQFGSPSSVLITSSNKNMVIQEFDTVGFTFAFDGFANTTNGTVNVRAYLSYDGGAHYGISVTGGTPSPAYAFTYTAPTDTTGAGSYVIATNLCVRGATHIAFSVDRSANREHDLECVSDGVPHTLRSGRSRAGKHPRP
jgi:hypothetical protein